MLRTLSVPALVLTAALCPAASAQIEPPAGVFCSCPPTHSNSDSVMASVAVLDHVDGFLVRIGWDQIEPSRGVFDFTDLDRQFQLADQHGKDIALAIVQGRHTPAWLAAEGVEMIDYDFHGQTQTMAAAWDPIYQALWKDTIDVVGARYDGHARLALVHVTNATANGFEMQLPLFQDATFIAHGYTEGGYADSWKTILTNFAAAFPSEPVDVEVHPVFGSDAVANAVARFALGTFPDRCGLLSAWWSVNNADNAYPGMAALIQVAAEDAFAALQLVGSWVGTPQRFGNSLAEYQEAYARALGQGARYFEVWNADLLEPSLETFLGRLQKAVAR